MGDRAYELILSFTTIMYVLELVKNIQKPHLITIPFVCDVLS